LAETGIERKRLALWNSTGVVRLRSVIFTWQVAFVAIVLLGAGLRLHGMNWAEPPGAPGPLQMHPDERFLSMVSNNIDWPKSLGQYFDTKTSPLNPYNDGQTNSYVYGTFPLFMVKGIATIAGDDPAGPGNSYDKDIVWGRAITAMFDTITIMLVFALGWRLFNRTAGLVGALLYALSVLPTQLSHFWTMDPYVVFFGAAAVLLSALAIPRGSRDHSQRALVGLFLAIGLCVGLGLASKVTAWPLALAPIVVVGIRWGMRWRRLGLVWQTKRPAIGGHWTTDVACLALSGVVSLLVFRIVQPYAFTGPHFWDLALNPQWKADILQQLKFQNGDAAYPPFIQFAGQTPYLTPLRNILLWGLGPGISAAAGISLLVATVLMFRRRETAFVLPIVFVAAIFAFQGGRFVAFMRYFAPMYPVLCLMAGWGLVELWRWARDTDLRGWMASNRWQRWTGRFARAGSPRVLRWSAGVAIAAVLVYTAWWALAFQHIYSQTNTRIAASEWMYQNIPTGSTVTGEYWDDTLPYALPGQQYNAFPLVQTNPYDPDTPQKVHNLVYGSPTDPKPGGGLANADYVIISSDRVRDTVGREERTYPSTILYYEALDSGALGFEKVAEFTSHPTFLGISVNDSSAQESFTVYDHPTVRIYKKTPAFNAAAAEKLLDSAQPERAIPMLPKQGRANAVQFTAEQAQTQQDGGTFTDVFAAHGWTSHLPWLWWLVWLELAAFAALPWVTWLLRALPDRGYGLSKLLGLIAVVLPVWLLVAWGGPHFSMALTWVVYGLVLATGLALGYRRRESLRDDLRAHWKAWLAIEGAFLTAFGLFLLLRFFNPDLWYNPQGGEKPMEIAYLTAISRSTILPPYDPWFAGGTMNYYYMGWFFLAVPIRALKILPEIAFNLGIPTFAALDAAVAFSLLFNMVAMGAPKRVGRAVRAQPWLRPALFTGLLGAILLIGIGNMDSLVQTIERFQAVSHVHDSTPVLGGAVELVDGFARWIGGAHLPPFDWWRPSRVHFGTFDITEFPYWSLLFSDLHPHLMDVPFFSGLVALVVAYAATVRSRLRVSGWLIAGLLGLEAGLIHTIQTWDYPTALLICGAGIVFGQMMREGRWQARWWEVVGHGAFAAAMVVVPFTPITRHFETFNSGLVRAPQTTKFLQYFDHFGLYVTFMVIFLVVRYWEELRARNGNHGKNPVLAAVNGWPEVIALVVFVAGLTAFTWRWGLTTIALSVMAEIFLLNLLWLEFRASERNLPRAFATAMLALAVGIAAGVDIVTLKGDLERMNTVFKFSLQAWQLYALGSAFAAWYALRALWRTDGWRASPRRASGGSVAAWVVAPVMVGFVLAGSIFLFSGTRARQNARFNDVGPTLNGLAFLQGNPQFTEDKGTPDATDNVTIDLNDDWPLIEWLRNNVQGSPVIVEAVGPLYHWTGRISEYTGLPAVIGWDYHQTQQRADYTGLISERRQETAMFYSTPDASFAEQYLLKYNVSYVVVGTEERVFGTSEAIANFDHIPALTKVFSDGRYAIYHVDPGKLPPPSTELVQAG
jgi:YYY domain-containing protein